jgi:hypothetical protein
MRLKPEKTPVPTLDEITIPPHLSTKVATYNHISDSKRPTGKKLMSAARARLGSMKTAEHAKKTGRNAAIEKPTPSVAVLTLIRMNPVSSPADAPKHKNPYSFNKGFSVSTDQKCWTESLKHSGQGVVKLPASHDRVTTYETVNQGQRHR